MGEFAKTSKEILTSWRSLVSKTIEFKNKFLTGFKNIIYINQQYKIKLVLEYVVFVAVFESQAIVTTQSLKTSH